MALLEEGQVSAGFKASATAAAESAATGTHAKEAMKLRHSDSLILVWRVAAFEARQLKASTIEPTHLLLGLCKTVDLDLPALFSDSAPDRDEVLEELLREVRRLRSVFRAADLDAKAFRHRLRCTSVHQRFALADSDRLRRSKAAKQVFADAEHFAELGDSAVYPVHLLYAVLLADDAKREKVFTELGINKKRLVRVTKDAVLITTQSLSAKGQKTMGRLN